MAAEKPQEKLLFCSFEYLWVDPLLTKAKPNSDVDSTSVMTYLRRKNHTTVEGHFAAGERSENSADPKFIEEGGGGGGPGTGEDVPLQPVEKTMVRQAVPLQSMEVHGRADTQLQPGEKTMPEHMDAQWKAPVDP